MCVRNAQRAHIMSQVSVNPANLPASTVAASRLRSLCQHQGLLSEGCSALRLSGMAYTIGKTPVH